MIFTQRTFHSIYHFETINRFGMYLLVMMSLQLQEQIKYALGLTRLNINFPV